LLRFFFFGSPARVKSVIAIRELVREYTPSVRVRNYIVNS